MSRVVEGKWISPLFLPKSEHNRRSGQNGKRLGISYAKIGGVTLCEEAVHRMGNRMQVLHLQLSPCIFPLIGPYCLDWALNNMVVY